jgi:hypothetical protein
MSEHTDVVERADLLMQAGTSPFGGRRRRSFVAATTRNAELTSTPLPTIDDDDLPVLTDVVPAEVEPVSDASNEPDEEALLSIIAADLVHSIEQQLAIELPTLIEATLINAQNELRAGVNSTLEMALRDFLARRQQLRLPLDEPK